MVVTESSISHMEAPSSRHCTTRCFVASKKVRFEHFLTYKLVLKFYYSANWRSVSSHDPLPPNAIYAGNDSDGSAIYVGRSYHENELLPAKVIPSKNVAYSE